MSALVFYVLEVFFAGGKLFTNFGAVVIYPAFIGMGFPDKHRAPEHQFAALSALQAFALTQFKLFLHAPGKQVRV